MGNDYPFAQTGKVMVIGGHFRSRVKRAIPVKVADLFLLLGIHTENRIACGSIVGFVFRKLCKLLIAVGDFFQGLFFWALRRLS